MALKVTRRKDPSTQSERRVIGDCRLITGFLQQPQAKYVTGGFSVTAQELGFDKSILDLKVNMDKEGKAAVTVERVTDSEWKLKFFSAIGTELANESESMSGKEIPFLAVGE